MSPDERAEMHAHYAERRHMFAPHCDLPECCWWCGRTANDALHAVHPDRVAWTGEEHERNAREKREAGLA